MSTLKIPPSLIHLITLIRGFGYARKLTRRRAKLLRESAAFHILAAFLSRLLFTGSGQRQAVWGWAVEAALAAFRQRPSAGPLRWSRPNPSGRVL